MASKTIFYKEQPFVIEVEDVDAELLEKSWSCCFDTYKSKKTGLVEKGSYFKIKRTLRGEEKALRGTSRTSLHKEVWMRHYGEVPAGMTIDHIDFNTCNNRITNLRLQTTQVNRPRKPKKEQDNGEQMAKTA
jgi:hypothetical protein